MIKKDRPDEVFEAPGFRMERRGRYVTLDSHRTREEHKRRIKYLIDNRPRFLEDIQNATTELISKIHDFNSLELPAHLWFVNSVGDPDEYKEYSFEGRPPYVEHLAALELKDPAYKVHTLEMPRGDSIERANQLLHEIFEATMFYYGTEGLEPSRSPSISRLQQLRFETILYELVVRSPAYFHHWADILRKIFSKDFVSDWMRRNLGFDIEDGLKCVQATNDLVMEKLHERRHEAHKFATELTGYVKEFKRTGRFTGPERIKDIVNRIRNMRNKDAKRAIQSITTSWAFYDLHETCSFLAPALAIKAGVTPNSAQSFLDALSLQFGSTPADYLLPNPLNPLRQRPIIHYNENYFSPAVHLPLWALKPCVEASLKPGSPNSLNHDIYLWERYQTHRSQFLIQEGLKYFHRLLPRAEIFSEVEYIFTEKETEKRVELDGLILYDRYIFLLEGKSGELSSSARRGGNLRLIRDVKELVAEPHRQALRAASYISSARKPTFYTKGGASISFDTAHFQRHFLVTLTLEALDVFTKELWQLRELGIFEAADLPWAVSLSDLRIISETILFPAQFTHYLKWRLHLNQVAKINAQSELDWLGFYIAEGPKLVEAPAGYGYMSLTTYTTAFDDFYLYEQGERRTPADRPAQFIPEELASVLKSIEGTNGYNYTAASECLLNLNFEERKLLATELQRFWVPLQRGRAQENKQLVGEETVVILRSQGADHEELTAQANSARTATSKCAVVLLLSTEKAHQVIGWGVSERLHQPTRE